MVTVDELLPYTLTYAQQDWTFTSEQKGFGKVIIEEALKAGLGYRGAVVGIATALQESGLRNINGGDRDSLGLFQQRPSMGWGTPAQIMDPHYSSAKFFSTMKEMCPGKYGPNYLTERQLWEVAQTVQRSGFPTYYAKHERASAELVAELAGDADDTPKRVSLGRNAEAVFKPNERKELVFDVEYDDAGNQHGAGGSAFVYGPAHYIATASATLTGLKPGTTIQTRFVEVKGPGSGEPQKLLPVQEHLATTGSTFISQTTTGAYVADGNRVQWHIDIADGTDSATVTSGTLQANYWKS
ncbi:hypothetical protein [Streptomyces sp. NPDC003077]|uniref:hypothetical protein n=1 Tax=Streptomyces sp. NPDC003077 TaxID=3154443 RepID=UPI0033A4E598